MEKENTVSIWAGHFVSESEFAGFVREKYDENGDLLPSTFMQAFGIDYMDTDFQEILFQENLSKEELFQASYADTFVDKIDNLSGNSVLLLYNFCYAGKIAGVNNFHFLGAFHYRKE